MKLSFTSILVSVGLLTFAISASAQTIIVANGTPNSACGNATFVLALSGCTGCTITRWEEISLPTFTVLATYPGTATFTCSLTAPSQKYFRPVFTRPGSPGEWDVGLTTLTTSVPPTVGTLSTPTTSFLNSGSGQLTLTNAVGRLTWSHIASSTDVNGTVTSNFNITNTTSFKATVYATNGGCPSVQSNTVKVDVYKTGTLSGSTSVIEGEKLNLSSSGNIIRWEYSINGGTTWINFDYSSYNNGTVTGDKLADTHEIWTNTKFRVLIDIGTFGTAYTNTLDVAYIPYTQANASPANGGNYIREQEITVSGITSPASLDSLTASQKRVTTVYQDGNGRTIQQNVKNGSPLQKDLIGIAAYDHLGRQPTQYLSYKSSVGDGAYRSGALSEQASFYANGTSDKVADSPHPYAKTIFEKSPLGRVLEQGGVGSQWQPGSGHSTTITYSNNVAAEVRLIKSDGTSSGFYAANDLAVVEVTDPDGKKRQTFTDKSGRTIVSRVQLDETVGGTLTPWLETYYVYYENGAIKYTISPKGVAALKTGSWSLTQSIKDQYVHQFVYDGRGRLTEKKVPGQAWLYYCYDRFDRLVLVQDGNLRAQNKWVYVKYDRRMQPVIQGLYTNTSQTTRAGMQQNVIDPLYVLDTDKYYEQRGTTAHGYTNQVFPSTNTEVLTVNYYDTYDFDYNGSEDYSYTPQGLANENTPANGRNFLTGSKRVIVGTTTWLYNYIFYDKYSRPIQVRSNNHLSAAIDNLTTLVYDFEGKVLTKKTYHNADAGRVTTVVNKYGYDHMARLIKVWQNINNTPTDQLVVQYEYNELGQLVDKKLHNTSGTAFLQSVDYRYNIQGWLQSINNAQLNVSSANNDETNDYFGMEFIYENVETGLNNTPDFNGSISAVKWKGVGDEAGTENQKSYKYTYDKADRLKTATSQMRTGSAWTKEANAFNEIMTYDLNGNILTLQRNQRKHQLTVQNGVPTASYISEAIDNLTYTYSATIGDQLIKVEDASNNPAGFLNGVNQATEYFYNTDGSIIEDRNKGISSVVYNFLGKPSVINFTDGRKVEYTYDVSGTKLTMKTYQGTTLQLTTDYADGFVYENGSLSFFGSPEGRVVRKPSGALEYQYGIADHQGNTRVVFTSVSPSETITATFEGNTGDHASQFVNVEANHVYTFPSANNTPSGSKVIRMNQTYKIGPSKSLNVFPGDKVDLEVWEYHEGSSGYGTTSTPLTTLITMVSGAFGGMNGGGGESGLIYNGVNSAINAFSPSGNQGSNQPAACLNYILFDRDYKVLDMGWQSAPAATFTRQKLSFNTLNIKKAGYLFVYLSYDNDSNNWVYFDDLKITHTKTNVIQYNEYYPFGLQTNTSWTREDTKNDFLYNEGSELNRTSGWYETMFRNYDPAIGRFAGIDPLATRYTSYSGYHYAGNNPVMLNDPSGASWNGYTWTCDCPHTEEMSNEEWMDYYDDMLTGGYAGYVGQQYASQQLALFRAQNRAWQAEAEAIAQRYEQGVADWQTYLQALSQGITVLPEVLYTEVSAGKWPSWWGNGGPGASGGELSSKSFIFQDVTSNWQVAAVTGLKLSVDVAGQPGTYKEIVFNLEVGVPKKLKDGTFIGKNYAAESSANVANLTAIEISLGFAKQYYKPGATALVPKMFATAMEAQLQAIIPGARVNSILTAPVTPHPAVWEKYWWQKLFGD